MAPISDYQLQITTWKEEGLTNSEIIGRLYDEGVQTSISTLKRHLQNWGVRCSRITTLPVTDELINRVQDLYLKNLLSDTQIASRIADEQGNCPTANQIKEIRLKHNIQRRVKKHDDSISALRTEATRAAVAHLVKEDGGRSFGYRWARGSLRRRLGHNARE